MHRRHGLPALLLFASMAMPMLALKTAAAAAPAADAPKVGYVDMARALNDVEDGKSAKARLKAEVEGKQKKLDDMKTKLEAKKEDLTKRASMMKPEVRQQKEEELQRELMDAQRVYMQLRQEVTESETAIIEDIGKKLRAIIEKIGDRDGYLTILNTGDTVLYFKRHMDLTDDVIRAYNKQYGKK
jgi:outer membrane protein